MGVTFYGGHDGTSTGVFLGDLFFFFYPLREGSTRTRSKTGLCQMAVQRYHTRQAERRAFLFAGMLNTHFAQTDFCFLFPE